MPTATRVAILADVHGNAAALEAVLADVAHHTPDLVVFAGDLVLGGPAPVEALARIRALNARAVMGNTDVEVLEATSPSGTWLAAQLDAPALAYLRSLPLMCRVTPPAGHTPNDDLLIVHATPHNCFDVLVLEVHPLGTTFNHITPEAEAVDMLAGACANLIVFGHIHYASERVIAGQRVVSVGAVGFPFDGDHRAAYAMAAWNGRTWIIEHHRVPYDYERVAQQCEQSDHPYAARQAAILRAANWLPRLQ